MGGGGGSERRKVEVNPLVTWNELFSPECYEEGMGEGVPGQGDRAWVDNEVVPTELQTGVVCQSPHGVRSVAV